MKMEKQEEKEETQKSRRRRRRKIRIKKKIQKKKNISTIATGLDCLSEQVNCVQVFIFRIYTRASTAGSFHNRTM